jgi:hypothetical protein
MLNKQNLIIFFKCALITLFVLLIIFEVLNLRNSVSSRRRTLVLITLVIILLYKNKFTWLIGIVLSGYAWYYLATVASKYSYYVAFDFTATLKYLFKPLPRTTAAYLIQGFPFYYYSILFIILLTPYGRRLYNVHVKDRAKTCN